jgi:hypothetical protein
MKLDLKIAAKRLCAGYLDGTLSGYPTELEGASQYIELYYFVFMDKLEELGHASEHDLEVLLGAVIDIVHVGDVLGDMTCTCIFGLVLLDRIAETGWGKHDFARCFYLHEQMFECYEQVMDSAKAKKKAREAAAKRVEKTNSAKAWVRDEWALKKPAYKGNKSDFARTYASLVRVKFTDNKGDPLSITEKTIRESWLSDTPPAG